MTQIKTRLVIMVLSFISGNMACAQKAVSISDLALKPGLYQVERDSTIQHLGNRGNSASVRLEQSNAGSTRGTWRGNGVTATRDFSGEPQRLCIGGGDNGAAHLPKGERCRSSSQIINDNAFVITAQCSFGTTRITVTKLSDTQWEEQTEVQMAGGMVSSGDDDGLRAFLEQMAQHAPTERERADARQRLAALPAQAGAQATSPTTQVVSRARYTKIAGTCAK